MIDLISLVSIFCLSESNPILCQDFLMSCDMELSSCIDWYKEVYEDL